MIAAGNRTIFNAGQTVDFADRIFEVVNELVYKLQIGASAACKNIYGHLTRHVKLS
jgi:hypothetical protein